MRTQSSRASRCLLRIVSWAGICLGWALATLIVARYTGLARRVDDP